MSDALARLFDQFDQGHLSRRRLLQALGIAAVLRPAAAFAQGTCGAANATLPRCNPTPATLPFEPTGWKTVLLDHFSMQVADYKKEAAYYAALMNWKIRSDDGTQAVMDIGDWGGLVIKGGYQAPPPAAPAAGAGATAGGRAAGAGGGRGPAIPRLAAVTGFCWGITPWDTKKVEAELRKRGLDPIADHDPKNGFESFHVKDPGGFDLQISNGTRKNRRQKPATGSLGVAAPWESTTWKTVWLDHISFEVADYKAIVAFYAALLGWKPGVDEGSLNQVEIGDVGDVLIRGGDRSHLIRHRTVRSRRRESGTGEARTQHARGHRQHRRHPSDEIQELPHDDAERLRPADQQPDLCDTRPALAGREQSALTAWRPT